MKKKYLICTYLVIFLIYFINSSYKVHAEPASDSSYMDKGRIIISNYKVLNETITPGDEFDVDVTFKNVSKENNVSSILITYTNSIDSIYTMYGDVGQIFIEKLNAQKEYKATLHLCLSKKITSESVPLQLSIVYADTESTTNTNNITLQLPIGSVSKLKIDSATIINNSSKEGKELVRVFYQNISAQSLYNVKLDISGEETEPINIGMISADASEHYDAYIDKKDLDKKDLKIKMTYEDKKGIKNTTEEYELKVTEREGDLNSVQDNSEESITTPRQLLADMFDIPNMGLRQVILTVGIIVSGILLFYSHRELRK